MFLRDDQAEFLTYSATSAENTRCQGRKSITGFVKRAYMAYFKASWGPGSPGHPAHGVQDVRGYPPAVDEGRETSLKFWIPMVGESRLTCNRLSAKLQYPDLPSARRPVAHCEDIP
ncbi:Uncharacterized protein FKW44_019888, partial [Caligus rogercresseyi]